MAAPRSFTRRNWALAAAVLVLMGMACIHAPAIAQTSSEGPSVAISAVGPVEVLSISPQSLVLATARKPLVINLEGQNVEIRDQNGQQASMSAIEPGMSVAVLRRASAITIRVVPKQEAQDDKAI